MKKLISAYLGVFLIFIFIGSLPILGAVLSGEGGPVSVEQAGKREKEKKTIKRASSKVKETKGEEKKRETPLTREAAEEKKSPEAASYTSVAPKAIPSHAKRYITIDFDNVDLPVFARFISEMTGKNIIYDEKFRGKATIISPRKVTLEEAYKIFESVLDVNGYCAVPAGEMIKIVPVQQAKEKALETRVGTKKEGTEDRMATQIIPLNYANPDEVRKVLEPLVPKTSVIVSYAPTSMLIVTDFISNIRKIMEIVEAIDQKGLGAQLTYLPLKHAVASDLVTILTTIFQHQKGFEFLKFVADSRNNAVIVLGTETQAERIKNLISLMDKDTREQAVNVHVYRLQNAWAEDLAKVLMNLPKAGATPQAGATTAAAPLFSKNVQIVADKATNTLVITADRADYAILEKVIKQLDTNRPMVYLETLIMEVSVEKNLRLGVEWAGVQSFSYATDAKSVSRTGGIIGGMSGEGYANITGLMPSSTKTIPTLPSGLSLGIIGQGISVAMGSTTLTFPNFAALLQFFQSDSDISVLATPQLLTMENEEAEINISKNIPYITRLDQTNVGVTGTNYSNYEYKDVGIIIKLTPHINEDGYIRVKIDMNVSSVDTSADPFRPTTRKRSVKTTVMLKDGNTLVIGGLIQDNSESGVSKAPFLGDIPVLGWLFKYKRKTMDKTNLFFFISPRVIRTVAEAQELTKKKNAEAAIPETQDIKMFKPVKAPPKKESEK